MILYRWQGSARNFGDELNTLLWSKLLPDFFDDDPGIQFLGIGSILDRRHLGPSLKVVAGSGYGGYEDPLRLDSSWLIHWVRGPHTARSIGVPPELGFGDPAALIPLVVDIEARSRSTIGFMPHFESASNGAWQPAAAAAGLRLIDPRGDPVTIISAIAECQSVISEALHGVIVADALRVPWIAVRPLAPVHRAKWQDWANPMELGIRFHRLPASSLLERARASALAGRHLGRCLLSFGTDHLRSFRSERFVAKATDALDRLTMEAPQLSSEAALVRSQGRMLERLRDVRRDALRPQWRMRPEAFRQSRCSLPSPANSAYHAR